jgi:hypothetical protein
MVKKAMDESTLNIYVDQLNEMTSVSMDCKQVLALMFRNIAMAYYQEGRTAMVEYIANSH